MAEGEETVHEIHRGIEYLGMDNSIILFSVLVIAIPFITGTFLVLLRGLEIKRDKKYNENFTAAVGVGGLAASWVLSLFLSQNRVIDVPLTSSITK